MNTFSPFPAGPGPARRAVPALLLAACASTAPPRAAGADGAFKPVQRAEAAPLLSKEDLALLEESANPIYRIGSGDVLRLDVLGRPEVSGKHVVGPDGKITVPLIGDVSVGDMTREAAAQALDLQLRAYFTHPRATLGVEEYTSNQVTVLGRVERAGVQQVPASADARRGAGQRRRDAHPRQAGDADPLRDHARPRQADLGRPEGAAQRRSRPTTSG